MALSEAGICNVALLRVGVTATIDAITDDTTEARACLALYQHNRDRLLSEAPWRFATRRSDLSVLQGVERSGWEYAYALPSDLLLAREIWCGIRAPQVQGRLPFVVEGDATHGQILLCDVEATAEEPLELLYTARVAEPGRYPAHFSEALAWSMASDLAMALAVKEPLSARARQMYEASLSRAMAIELGHVEADLPPDSELISIRG